MISTTSIPLHHLLHNIINLILRKCCLAQVQFTIESVLCGLGLDCYYARYCGIAVDYAEAVLDVAGLGLWVL